MAFADYLTSNTSLGLAFALLVSYYLGLGAYRLYFSPIARFPGPKLAGLSFWYEFYWDVIKGGQYTWEIGRMHDKYGPIVRINPYELHIRDDHYYDELYAGGSKKRDKWEWSAKMFGNSTSMLGTISHDHHRIRRGALNPYFSKRSVARLEPMIRSVVEKLCVRLRKFRETKEPVNLVHAYSALTMDIITEYTFAKSYDTMDTPDFSPKFPETVDAISKQSHLNKQVGWLLPMMNMMPLWLVEKMNPDMMLLINFQKDLVSQVQGVMARKAGGSPKDSTHPSIFSELLDSDLPADEKTVPRLVDEAQTVVAAGQVTTAHYLKTVSYHLLANPDILGKLKSELRSAIPDGGAIPPLSKIEKLPYLAAVVAEGFRKSYGVTSRLQRVSPDEPLTFHEWVIPAGTPVGMTSIFQHDNPKVFPDPYEFRPNRWLNPGSRDRLEKYLVNFSKGSRACLGLNLAHAEIYLTLASVFREFDMTLFETTREDVDVAHDYFNPAPKAGSKGVRVIVN